MYRSVLALVFGLALAVAGSPSRAEGRFDFHAVSMLENPADAQVHASPDAGSESVGTLPTYKIGGQIFNGAEYRVTDMRDGWVRINEVRGVDQGRSAGPDGWIPAEFVEVFVLSRVSFTAPDAASAVAGPYDPVATQQILDCSGPWVKLSYTNLRPVGKAPSSYVGWVRGVCAIPELGTCDGLASDPLPEGLTAANP